MSRAYLIPDAEAILSSHCYPDGDRAHVTSGTGCWCEPHIYRFCT